MVVIGFFPGIKGIIFSSFPACFCSHPSYHEDRIFCLFSDFENRTWKKEEVSMLPSIGSWPVSGGVEHLMTDHVKGGAASQKAQITHP
jgi:hypothetical protein